MAKKGQSGLPKPGRAALTPGSSNVDILSDEECWSLLRNHNLGRLAIVIEGRPRIFPVNYVAADSTVLIRTEPGAKLKHGPGSSACFEIDGHDPRALTAWSVMAIGVLVDITDANDERSQGFRRLPVEPAAPGNRLHWLALNTDEVSGRSFRGAWWVPGHYLG